MTLVGATVASVWDDIFHHPDDETVLDDTLAYVRWMHSEWDGFPDGWGFRDSHDRPRICNEASAVSHQPTQPATGEGRRQAEVRAPDPVT